jgi:arylsulfatase A-like enzyme
VTLPDDVGIDSVDISPLLYGRTDKQVRGVTVHQGIKLAAVRKSDYKLIPGQGTGGTFNKIKVPEDAPEAQLYNVRKDMGEKHNLYANPEYAGVRKDLEAELEKLRGSKDGWDKKW